MMSGETEQAYTRVSNELLQSAYLDHEYTRGLSRCGTRGGPSPSLNSQHTSGTAGMGGLWKQCTGRPRAECSNRFSTMREKNTKQYYNLLRKNTSEHLFNCRDVHSCYKPESQQSRQSRCGNSMRGVHAMDHSQFRTRTAIDGGGAEPMNYSNYTSFLPEMDPTEFDTNRILSIFPNAYTTNHAHRFS